MPVRPSIRKDSHSSQTLTFNHKLPLRGRYKCASFNKQVLPRNKIFFPNLKYLTMDKGQHSQPAAGKSWVGLISVENTGRDTCADLGCPCRGLWGPAGEGEQLTGCRSHQPEPPPAPALQPPHPWTCTMSPQQPQASKKQQEGKYLGSFEWFFSTVLMIKHSTTQNTGQLTESLLMAQQPITSILLDER